MACARRECSLLGGALEAFAFERIANGVVSGIAKHFTNHVANRTKSRLPNRARKGRMDQPQAQVTRVNIAPQAADLIVARPEGLYCPPGDFYIDPWQPVERAVITHAHGDHLRMGHGHYLTSEAGRHVVTQRVGPVDLQTLAYDEAIMHKRVRISVHPAG